jgi:Glycosyltransferase family 9 (heptosyltransferase)
VTDPRRLLIAPVSFGLGDLVVSLPLVRAAVQEGARSGIETWLVARSPGQAALAERVGGLGGVVPEGQTGLRSGDRLVDLRDHPLQRDHWWGTPEFEAAYGPLSINQILAGIGTDLGIIADFSAPVALESRVRADADGLVLLVADAAGTTKQWAPPRWVELADALARRGVAAAVVTRGGPGHPLVDRGIAACAATTPGEAVDVLTAARAVVGVDTGLTHIAAQQGTPTVTISRRPAVYFRDWPHTRLVAGSSCDPGCRRAEQEYAYNDRIDLSGCQPAPRVCPAQSSCLASVVPESVMTALDDLW